MNYSVYTYMSKACRLARGIALATALHYSAVAFAQDAFEHEMLNQEGRPPAPHAQQLSEEEILAMEASEEAGRALKPLTQPLSEAEFRALEAFEEEGRAQEPRAQGVSVQATRRQVANGKIRGLVAAARGQSGKAPRLGKTRDGYLRFFGAPETGRAMVAENLRQRSPEEQARGFVLDHAEAFGVTSPDMDFKIHKVRSKGERNYVRMRQTYAGLPVFCAETIVQLDNAGGVHAVFSDIMRDARRFEEDGVPLVPTISAKLAMEAALADRLLVLNERVAEHQVELEELYQEGDISQEMYSEQIAAMSQTVLEAPQDAELMVFDPSVVGAPGRPCLVWHLVVKSTPGHYLSEQVLIDAHHGKVIHAFSLICEAINRTIYDANHSEEIPPDLVATRVMREWEYPLNLLSGGLYFQTYNRNYSCLGMAYDYFLNNHGWLSYDGDGGEIISNTRWGLGLSSYNAWAYGYPDGSGVWHYSLGFGMLLVDFAVADDIVAHEFTHLVTMNTSNLLYFRESGAINESLSDIWGNFVDEANDTSWDDDSPGTEWLVGEEVMLGGLRHMDDPNASLQPDRYNGLYFYTGPEDNGGVHINSGVGNKLAYLLTDGDTFNGRSVYGMGEAKVRQLYWECQTNLLSRGADYSYLYDALTQAALNLSAVFSANDRANIEQACQAVEISTSVPAFIIRDAEGNNAFEFQSDGDLLLLKGGKVFDGYDGVTSAHLAPTSAREVILRDGPYNSNVFARFDTETGNLYIRGTKHENVGAQAQRGGIHEFVIRVPSGESREIVATLDDLGSLWLKGSITHDRYLQLDDF